jgi:membrane protease YdiL (CAAX protease family)
MTERNLGRAKREFGRARLSPSRAGTRFSRRYNGSAGASPSRHRAIVPDDMSGTRLRIPLCRGASRLKSIAGRADERVSRVPRLSGESLIRLYRLSSRAMASSPAASQEPSASLQEYAAQSSRPLVSMAFVVPLLLIYELGVILLGPQALRNGADTWLRLCLESIGFGQYFLLPLLTCGVLLAWHHTRRDAWALPGHVLTGMLLESILLALLLFGFAHAHRALFLLIPQAIPPATMAVEAATTVGRLIGYCGAGIYEELLFRLIMLPALACLLRWGGLGWRACWWGAVVASSLIFSAAHYHTLTPGGYLFDWYSFSFRFAAGMFFAALFVLRGFGIAAGVHALYNVLVEIV